MTALLADAAPLSDLLDVFNTYDGATVFQGLAEGIGGQPAVLGRIGWIFTGFGALFALWGFVLRTQRSAGEGKMEEVAKTWIVIGFMVGGPFIMRAAMEGADSLYASSFGNPANLTTACVKAAYAMPELNRLFDYLEKPAAAPTPTPAVPGAPITAAGGANTPGPAEALLDAARSKLSDFASETASTWNSMVRLVGFATGFGSMSFKCLIIVVTLVPLYLLLLAAAAIVWFMQQLRFFLAVSGSMMLPLFVGMFSLPSGHSSRQAAQAYVMHMISLALWPVAWAIGHSGTVVLYNALISLIAGTSRVPDLIAALQWNSITASGVTTAQVAANQAALGNWFMGNVAALLSLLVGGFGFVLWVFVVSIMGPVFLHKVLSGGALFMAEAAGSSARMGLAAGRLALDTVQSPAVARSLGLIPRAAKSEGNFVSEPAGSSGTYIGHFISGGQGGASMPNAAKQVDDSSGNDEMRV